MKYNIEYNHKEKDFEDVWHIEKDYLESSTIASVNQVIKWENKNNNIHIFVRDIDKNKIVGEITILPLSEVQFQQFITNKLEDTEINEDTLLKYERDKSYYLLFSAIAIDKEYRNERVILSLLMKGFYDKIKYLQENKITFLNMCAEGQTLKGQKFIESFLNLKHKSTTKEGYKLYSFESKDNFDKWFEIFPKYMHNYNCKFNINC